MSVFLKKKRQDAAKRGWETRRANAERARRSDAARRGWESRRQREAEKAIARARRSDAVKKSWDARRAAERHKKIGSWKIETVPPAGGWIVEQPVETVGGKKYKRKK